MARAYINNKIIKKDKGNSYSGGSYSTHKRKEQDITKIVIIIIVVVVGIALFNALVSLIASLVPFLIIGFIIWLLIKNKK